MIEIVVVEKFRFTKMDDIDWRTGQVGFLNEVDNMESTGEIIFPLSDNLFNARDTDGEHWCSKDLYAMFL